eukprot:Phypoly_transcript_03223.p1 GENE.Phypoly_transcript_03223~~Phypoly_transcript_03223.p1  ORF type:complete len:636 (-),score=101.66 Phypoly_transcript_03223:501-2408(-)
MTSEDNSLALALVSPIPSPVHPSSFPLGPDIIEACRHNRSEQLLELLNAGGDANFKDPTKNITPLYAACLGGHADCVQMLLSFGADPNVPCGKNSARTPLLLSIEYNYPRCTRILLDHAPSSISNCESLVEEAILSDRPGCLDALLEHGAKVNSVDKFGSTPLHNAANYGRLACIEVLLNYGAQIDAKDQNNKTPYEIAVAKGHQWANVLLKDADMSFLHSASSSQIDYSQSLSQNNADMSCSSAGSSQATLSQNISQNSISLGASLTKKRRHQNSSQSQTDYMSQSPTLTIAEDEKPVNLSTILYHDISTVPVVAASQGSTPSFPFSFIDSQLSQYSQQSQLGSQDLKPVHPPRYVRPNFEIDSTDLEIQQEIGSGFYGKVFKGLWQAGTPVAVKRITNSMDKKIGELTKKNFRLEMEMLMALRHPNIVLFLGVSIQSPNFYLVMEYMPRGSLANVLHVGGPFGKNMGMKARVRMAMDVACGMNYLHKQAPEPILHRDLKSSNLLVTEDLRIKVSDFGLARVKDGAFRVRNPLDITIQAPEVLKSRPTRYTEKSDIYSFGLLLWEIVTGQPLFENMEPKKIAAEVLKGVRPKIPPSCPEPLSGLMSRCWDEDPQLRPIFQEIVKELRTLDQPNP